MQNISNSKETGSINCGHSALFNISGQHNEKIYHSILSFSNAYSPIHTYVSLIICSVGLIMNILNIIVLTRPSMRTPINCILTVIAFCDCSVMLSYTIFLLHFKLTALKRCRTDDFTYAWAVFAMFHAHISAIGHSASLWLSVTMAHIRYMMIRGAESGKQKQIVIKHAVMISIAVLLSICICSIPQLLLYTIQPTAIEEVPASCMSIFNETTSTYSGVNVPFLHSRKETKSDCVLASAAFWIAGLIMKIVPCCLLSVFIGLLMRVLTSVKQRRERRLSMTNTGQQAQQSDRTTRMLVALLAIFLITEVPQGLLSVATGIFSLDFTVNIYQPLGDVLDLLSLINSAINFVIYCTMSKRFRDTFYELFLPVSFYGRLQTAENSRRPTRDQTITYQPIRTPILQVKVP